MSEYIYMAVFLFCVLSGILAVMVARAEKSRLSNDYNIISIERKKRALARNIERTTRGSK